MSPFSRFSAFVVACFAVAAVAAPILNQAALIVA
jgi:hypothetical protein